MKIAQIKVAHRGSLSMTLPMALEIGPIKPFHCFRSNIFSLVATPWCGNPNNAARVLKGLTVSISEPSASQ